MSSTGSQNEDAAVPVKATSLQEVYATLALAEASIFLAAESLDRNDGEGSERDILAARILKKTYTDVFLCRGIVSATLAAAGCPLFAEPS